MVMLLSYPLRLALDGSFATVEDGMDYYGEELAMLVRTIVGERELVPEYGIQDPTFHTLSKIELMEKVALFGPPVEIVKFNQVFTMDGRISVTVGYDEIDLG